MVSVESPLRFKSNTAQQAATSGQFGLDPRISTRFAATAPIADTVNFGHQTAAAPQFSGWQTWANRLLIALTLGTTALPACQKGGPLDPVGNENPTTEIKTWADAINLNQSFSTIKQGDGTSSTLKITFKDNVTVDVPEGQATLLNPYTYYDSEGNLKQGTDTTLINVEKLPDGLLLTNPYGVFVDGGTTRFSAPGVASPRGGVPEEFVLAGIKGTIQAGDYVKYAPHFEVKNLNGSFQEMHPNAPHKRADMENYAVSSSNLSTYLSQRLSALNVPAAKQTKLLAALTNANFKEATLDNPQIQAMAIGTAAFDPTDSTLNALIGNPGPNGETIPRLYFATGITGSNAETKSITKHGLAAYQIGLSNNFLTVDPFVGACVLIGNEITEQGNGGSKREQLYQAPIQDYFYRKLLASVPLPEARTIYEQTHPINKMLNGNNFGQVGSAKNLDPRLSTTLRYENGPLIRPQIDGKGSVFTLDDSYRNRIYRAYANNSTYPDVETLSVTAPMANIMEGEFGITPNDVPSQYNGSGLPVLLNGINTQDAKIGGWSRFYQVAGLSPVIEF